MSSASQKEGRKEGATEKALRERMAENSPNLARVAIYKFKKLSDPKGKSKEIHTKTNQNEISENQGQRKTLESSQTKTTAMDRKKKNPNIITVDF